MDSHQAPEVPPAGVRTLQAVPGIPCCGACGTPIPAPRKDQRACSGKCRAHLHRQEQAAARAARDAEVRRLAEAIVRLLAEGGTR
jgi:predicted nucleic acid-binding Zn ribbon protein